MPPSFFDVFPREIRDQIYTYILQSPFGSVSLQPWTVEVARSLSVLRVSKQMHRECKDIIWTHKGLVLRGPTTIYKKLSQISNTQRDLIRSVTFDLEVLDRDELEWVSSGLIIMQNCPRLEDITLQASWDSPRDLHEFRKTVELRKCHDLVDGRLFQGTWNRHLNTHYETAWPRFSHWGKQRWVKRMLSDPSGIDQLLQGLNGIFGGELFVDGILCFKNKLQVAPCSLDPGNGIVRIIPGSAVNRRGRNGGSLAVGQN